MAVVSFAFVESSITVPESVGDVVLCTELSGADIAIPLTISYEIIDGSATGMKFLVHLFGNLCLELLK